MPTLRHTRYQAAVIRDRTLLLVQCAFRDGPTVWILPGGGREEGEDEEVCVAREVLEETGVSVRVDRLLMDTPAGPPDGTYVRRRVLDDCELTAAWLSRSVVNDTGHRPSPVRRGGRRPGVGRGPASLPASSS